jgi:hypothetical protein
MAVQSHDERDYELFLTSQTLAALPIARCGSDDCGIRCRGVFAHDRTVVERITRVDFFFVAATTLYMLCFLAWFWSLGSFLNSIVKPELKLKTTFLHIALIYPAIYMPFFLAVFFDLKPELFMVVLPLHLFAMFCIFYLLRFASKTLALAETGRTVSFYDYAGPFFLLWFYPVGVWIIQPRINRLYAENTVTASRLRP